MDTLKKIQQLLKAKGTEEGLFILLQALKEPNFRVRKIALESLLEAYPRERLIKYLIEFLYIEDNAAARNTAIQALISIGPQALKSLQDAYKTDNADVRKFIVDIVGQMHTPRAVPLLLEAVQDSDDNVRAAAVEYLGRLKAKEAVGPLVRMLQEESLWVKYSVIEALGMIGTREILPILEDALQDRTLTEVVLRAFGNFKEKALIGKIVPYLTDKRRSVVSQALITLSRLVSSEDAIAVLRSEFKKYLSVEEMLLKLKDALRSDNVELKKAAIVLMGIFGGPDEVSSLLELATQDEVGFFVERAIGNIGRQFPHILESFLWKGYPEQKRFIARIMASLKMPLFYDAFMKALSEVDGHIIAIAARALSEMGDRQSVDKLIPLLGHPYPDVQEAVVDALVKLGRYLHTEELWTLLHSHSEVVRANAALIAGRLKRQALLEEIGLLTGDPSYIVRKAVAEAMACFGSEEAFQFIKRSLKDEEPVVRIAALSTLPETSPQWLINEIKPLLADPVPSVRVATIRALCRFRTKESLILLRRLLYEEDPYIVVHAIEALKDDLSPETTQAIKRLLSHHDREVRRTAIEAFALRAEEQTLMPYLLSEDWAIRLAAVKALSKYSSEISRKALRELYHVEEDPLVRSTIKEVLDVAG